MLPGKSSEISSGNVSSTELAYLETQMAMRHYHDGTVSTGCHDSDAGRRDSQTNYCKHRLHHNVHHLTVWEDVTQVLNKGDQETGEEILP